MAQRVTRGVQIAGYRRDDVEVDPPYLYPDYVATRTRSPKRPLLLLPHTLSEVTGPVYGHDRIGELDHDPGSQSPQAWSASATVQFLQVMLGL